MMTRLRRWLGLSVPPPAPSPEPRVQDFRRARSSAIAQTRESLRVQRALRNPGLDYSTLNRQTFGRPPREERR